MSFLILRSLTSGTFLALLNVVLLKSVLVGELPAYETLSEVTDWMVWLNDCPSIFSYYCWRFKSSCSLSLYFRICWIVLKATSLGMATSIAFASRLIMYFSASSLALAIAERMSAKKFIFQQLVPSWSKWWHLWQIFSFSQSGLSKSWFQW